MQTNATGVSRRPPATPASYSTLLGVLARSEGSDIFQIEKAALQPAHEHVWLHQWIGESEPVMVRLPELLQHRASVFCAQPVEMARIAWNRHIAPHHMGVWSADVGCSEVTKVVSLCEGTGQEELGVEVLPARAGGRQVKLAKYRLLRLNDEGADGITYVCALNSQPLVIDGRPSRGETQGVNIVG